MNDEDVTSLSLRLPAELRERIEKQAAAEDRTLSQFIRFHLSQLLETRPARSRRAAGHRAKSATR